MRSTASRGPSWIWCGESLWLLHAVVENVVLRTSEWVEDSEHSWAPGDRRDLIPLLAEKMHMRTDGRLESLLAGGGGRWAEAHGVELLSSSCDISKLLLKLSLLLREAGIGGQQFAIQALVKLSSMVVDLNSWRGKDLVRTQVHRLVKAVVVVACARKESARGSLWNSSIVVGVLRRRISAALEAKATIAR